MLLAFAPARALVGRLTYLEKFVLISVLFIAPLVTVMYAYISDGNIQIDFAGSELSGTRYLRPLNAVYADVLRARDAAHRAAISELQAVQKQLVTEMQALNQIDADLGKQLETAETFGIDSYYLMDVVVVELPSAQDSTNQIRARSAARSPPGAPPKVMIGST